MIAKFAVDMPISQEEIEEFVTLGIKELGPGSDVQLFQIGELEESVKSTVYN